jgi:hypothetical protein
MFSLHRKSSGLVCGVINSVLTVPVMTSFSAIIFQVAVFSCWLIVGDLESFKFQNFMIFMELQNPFFHNHLGSLVKLVFLSSAIHQTVFTLKSTLPFAVG